MQDKSPNPTFFGLVQLHLRSELCNTLTWRKTPENGLPGFGDCCQKQTLCKHLKFCVTGLYSQEMLEEQFSLKPHQLWVDG